MKNRNKSAVMALFLAILLCIPAGAAASFTSDLVQTERNVTKTARFYFHNPRQYRMDVVEKGQKLTVLVDRDAGKTRILAPESRVFIEIANTNMRSLMQNPFEAWEHISSKYKPQLAGRQKIQGLACQKQVVTIEGKQVMTAWIAAKYAFPVKISNAAGHTAELRNISSQDLSADLFAVPAGFRQVKKLPAAIPPWAKDIAAADLLKAPFTRKLSAGRIIKVAPLAGRWLKMTVSNAQESPSRFTAVAFKDGRPLSDTSFKTYNIKGGGQKLYLTSKTGPDEADFFVVRVARGKIDIKAVLEKSPPK